MEKEKNPDALKIDPYSVAQMLKRKDKLVPVIVGHIQKGISRFGWFYLYYGGSVNGKVCSEAYKPPLIPSRGLEIIIHAKFSR